MNADITGRQPRAKTGCQHSQQTAQLLDHLVGEREQW
jgi:hypothetical protein